MKNEQCQCLTQRLWPFFEEVDFQPVLQNAVFEKYESFNLLLWVKAQRPQISLNVVPLFFGYDCSLFYCLAKISAVSD
jgi:hypothetical protein